LSRIRPRRGRRADKPGWDVESTERKKNVEKKKKNVWQFDSVLVCVL